MDAEKALATFLTGSIKRKRERYLGFIGKRKNRIKFLDTIYHELERELDQSLAIKALPAVTKSIRGYRFAPKDEFGTPVSNLRDAWNSVDDSFLVISEDGQYAIHSPELYIDKRTIYRLNQG